MTNFLYGNKGVNKKNGKNKYIHISISSFYSFYE